MKIDLLKRICKIGYTSDGHFFVYAIVPIPFDARLLFALRHTRNEIEPRKIVFDNYMGKGFGCNPKYVAKALEERYPGEFDLVWIVSKGDMAKSDMPKHIRKVEYGSSQALREYATAKIWVSNYHKISFLKRGMFKRKGQCFIQMWHGSLGIKKIENDVSILTKQKKWLKLAKRSSEMVDYWISNSTFENEVYHRGFWGVTDNVLMYGHPRNDILFSDRTDISKKVRKSLGVGDKKILFYAPTFREDYRMNCYAIDFERLSESLKERFGGEWVIVVRLHPRVRKYASTILKSKKNVYDATRYADIQELIVSADCMITDYSSCIFDFALTGRPGFIFATDIEMYNNERGFYYPLEETPFPIATNNDELMENVLSFDDKVYQQKLEEFLQGKGCVEDGHASERVVELIRRIVEGEGEIK